MEGCGLWLWHALDFSLTPFLKVSRTLAAHKCSNSFGLDIFYYIIQVQQSNKFDIQTNSFASSLDKALLVFELAMISRGWNLYQGIWFSFGVTEIIASLHWTYLVIQSCSKTSFQNSLYSNVPLLSLAPLHVSVYANLVCISRDSEHAAVRWEVKVKIRKIKEFLKCFSHSLEIS